jgi:hypothetical protein
MNIIRDGEGSVVWFAYHSLRGSLTSQDPKGVTKISVSPADILTGASVRLATLNRLNLTHLEWSSLASPHSNSTKVYSSFPYKHSRERDDFDTLLPGVDRPYTAKKALLDSLSLLPVAFMDNMYHSGRKVGPVFGLDPSLLYGLCTWLHITGSHISLLAHKEVDSFLAVFERGNVIVPWLKVPLVNTYLSLTHCGDAPLRDLKRRLTMPKIGYRPPLYKQLSGKVVSAVLGDEWQSILNAEADIALATQKTFPVASWPTSCVQHVWIDDFVKYNVGAAVTLKLLASHAVPSKQ